MVAAPSYRMVVLPDWDGQRPSVGVRLEGKIEVEGRGLSHSRSPDPPGLSPGRGRWSPRLGLVGHVAGSARTPVSSAGSSAWPAASIGSVVVLKTSWRAVSNAVSRAPWSTGLPSTVDGTTRGRTGEIRPTASSTRRAGEYGATRSIDLAGEDHQARVDDEAHRGHTERQPLSQLDEKRLARLSALNCRSDRDSGRRRSVHRIGHQAVSSGKVLDRLRPDERLEPPLEWPWAPIACRRVAAGHRQPTDLPRTAARTPVQPAAEDGREPHAAPHPEQDEVVMISSSAAVQLGDAGKIHIVLKRDHTTQVTAQGIKQPAMPARQIPCKADVATYRIDQAGRADHNLTDLSQPDPGVLSRALDRLMHDGDRIGGTLGGEVTVSGHLTGNVGHSGLDPIRSHVDADHIGSGRFHRVEAGVRPPSTLLFAYGVH